MKQKFNQTVLPPIKEHPKDEAWWDSLGKDVVLPIEHCAEYDAAAEWCAKRGLKGAQGDPLPANMATDGALKYIQADIESFQERVKVFAYALAMEKTKDL